VAFNYETAVKRPVRNRFRSERPFPNEHSTAVSEVKRPTRNRFKSEKPSPHSPTDKIVHPGVGCKGYDIKWPLPLAKGNGFNLLYNLVSERLLTCFYLSSINAKFG
jgi:hypothetical protein